MRDEIALASSRLLPSTPGPEGTGGLAHCGLSCVCVISVYCVVRCGGYHGPLILVSDARLSPASVPVVDLGALVSQIFSRCSTAMRCSFFSRLSNAEPSIPRSSFRCRIVLWFMAPLTPSISLQCFTLAVVSCVLSACTICKCCCSARAS